jgi:hypothetical protein
MQDTRKGTAFSRFKDRARSLIQLRDSSPTPTQNLGVITSHIETYFGQNFFVLHEKKSTLVHIDVNVVLPSPARPYLTLLTSGMSDRSMCIPRGFAKLALAEVCLCLPKDWPISQKDTKWATPEYFWPIKVLKQVALYPHLHETWLSQGHTIGNIERPEPLDPTGRFVGLILLEPMTFPRGANHLLTDSGREIGYLAIVPLLREELAFKMENGSRALADKLSSGSVTELLDPHRPSVISI